MVVLDLTEMRAIGGGSVGVHGFSAALVPRSRYSIQAVQSLAAVREKLEHTSSMSEFDIASLDEMMALLGQADSRYALAS